MEIPKPLGRDQPNDLPNLESALDHYRRLGLKPIPLVNFGKKPLIHWGDPEAVAGARFAAGNNIGLLCEGGLIVQDFESKTDFELFYPDRSKLLGSTLVVSTPHGGVHVYWINPDPAPRSVRLFGDEHPVDYCGVGGYIAAPPSVLDHSRCEGSKCSHQGRSAYTIVSSTTEIAVVRNSFASTIRRGRSLGWKSRLPESAARPRHLSPEMKKAIHASLAEDPPCVKEVLKGVGEGTREWAAFLLGNYYATWRGMDGDAVVDLLLEWNQRNRPPLPEEEILAKFSRLGKYTLGCKALSSWCKDKNCGRPLDRLLHASRN